MALPQPSPNKFKNLYPISQRGLKMTLCLRLDLIDPLSNSLLLINNIYFLCVKCEALVAL